MKYITTQLNLRNGNLVLEPLYVPACSFGEPIYIRIITGNFKAKKITVLCEGKQIGSRLVLVEKMPTVFEAGLTDKNVLNISRESEMVFKMRIFVETEERDYEILSGDIVKILGMSFGPDYKTDLSLIYSQLNTIMDKINEL